MLRALFYATPIIYSANDLPAGFGWLPMVNPLDGIFSMYRAAFFLEQWDTASVISSVLWTIVLLIVGMLVFRRLERSVLKEL